MNTIKLLQQSIDYIEEHLKCEIDIDTLSKISGFSKSHFYHTFSSYVGMSVSAYITKRRVHHAIYHIQQTGNKTDTAFLYGFDTYAGFYKAFKREFGCSPSKFLKLYVAVKPTVFNLEKEVSMMLTNKQIRQLLSNWDMAPSLSIQKASDAGGAHDSKTTWIIGDIYTFKTGQDIAGLRTHLAISKKLEKLGMYANTPLTTIDGEDFVMEDGRFYCLMRKVPGRLLTPAERYASNRSETALKYGVAIGKLHYALLENEDELEVRDENILDMTLNWALPETRKTMEQWGCPLPEAFFEDYKQNFPELFSTLPTQVIHRDPNPSNIMFDVDQISGFIDFILSCRSVRLFDPCYCATGILSEANQLEEGFDKWPEILKGIIDGYDSICPLSKTEKKAIPYVIYSIQMIFIAWLIENEAYEGCARQNRAMLIWMWENKDKCFDKLI